MAGNANEPESRESKLFEKSMVRQLTVEAKGPAFPPPTERPVVLCEFQGEEMFTNLQVRGVECSR